MTTTKRKDVTEIIADIHRRLDDIETWLDWSIRADQRFKVGDRVRFNAKADRSAISGRRKNGVRTGRVLSFDGGCCMTVLLDGYTKPQNFHHAFFDHAPSRPSQRKRGARPPRPSRAGRKGRKARES